LAAARTALSELEAARQQGDAERDARISGLEGDKSTLSGERDALLGEKASLSEHLAQATDKNHGLEASLRELGERMAQAESALAAQSAASMKAHDKWSQDRASLERAKDALAAALIQIEEAESRPID